MSAAIGFPTYVGHLPANVDFIEIAPVLCAGVTVYKGLKVTNTKPGNWVVISGIGGPAAFKAARSCRKPRKGARPVPGPTIIIGVAGLRGSWNVDLVSLTKA